MNWLPIAAYVGIVGAAAHLVPEALLEGPVGKILKMPLGTKYITLQRLAGLAGIIAIWTLI